MVGVLAVVLVCVLACMGLECWLDGLWGAHGAGMLAGGLHRSWFFQKIRHKLVRLRCGTLVLGRCTLNNKGSPVSEEKAVRLRGTNQQYNIQTQYSAALSTPFDGLLLKDPRLMHWGAGMC